MKKFLLMFLLFSACSVIDEDTFYSKAVGIYSLNTTGIQFLKKVTGEEVLDGYTITFSGNSTSGGTLYLSYYDDDGKSMNITTIAKMLELKEPYQGLFMLCAKETYVAMGLEESMWISTTNAKSNPDDVLFAHLVPIATQDD